MLTVIVTTLVSVSVVVLWTMLTLIVVNKFRYRYRGKHRGHRQVTLPESAFQRILKDRKEQNQ